MNKTLSEVHKDQVKKYKTQNNTFEDFPVGTKVKVVAPCVDFFFFYGETGKVTKNTGKYLGISVKFDKPRCFEGGYIQKGFNFNPKDLHITKRKNKIALKKCKNWVSFEVVQFTCPHCYKDDSYEGYCPEEGDIIVCRKCKKKFKLGEEEE